MLLPMSAELYVALLAVFRLGMVALILDPPARREHIERCCALYPPQALIAGARAHLLSLRSPALRRIPLKISVGAPVPGAVSWARIDRTPPVPAVYPCDPTTPARLTASPALLARLDRRRALSPGSTDAMGALNSHPLRGSVSGCRSAPPIASP